MSVIELKMVSFGLNMLLIKVTWYCTYKYCSCKNGILIFYLCLLILFDMVKRIVGAVCVMHPDCLQISIF